MAKYICNVEERIFGSFSVEANSQEEAQEIAEELLRHVNSVLEVPNIQMDDDKEIEFGVE